MNIAQRLTGMDEKAFFSVDLPNIRSAKNVSYPHGVLARQNVRAFVGLIVGPKDLNQKRQELQNSIPPALKR
jgi:hypothetical protein